MSYLHVQYVRMYVLSGVFTSKINCMYSVTSLNRTPSGRKKWFSLERFPD